MAGSRRNRTTTKRTSNTRGSNTSLSTIQKREEETKKTTKNVNQNSKIAKNTQKSNFESQNTAFQNRKNNNANRTIGNPRRQTGVQQQVQQKKKETTNRLGQLTKGNLQTIAGQHETTFNAIRNPMEQQYIAAEEIRKQRGEKTPENLGLYEQLLNKERSGMKETREHNLEKAAKKIKKGEKNIEKSTEELGKVGKFAADLYGAGLGMASDALAGPAATASLLSRSFGGAYNRAKEEGADDSQAALYGAASGGMEALSEKMFAVATPLRKLYGAGAGDALTKKVMDKLESKASSYVGKNIASRGVNVFGSAVTEALEEMVVEGLDPFVANEIYAEAVGRPREFSWKDVGRAGLMGGAMGGLLGGAGNIVDYRQNSKQGARVQEVFGKDGVLELARETADSDESLGKNLTGEALAEMISNGESIVAGQANDIYKTVQQQRQKDEQRNQDSRAAADNIIQKNNYVEPSVIDPQTGEELLRRNTAKKLEEVKAETIDMSADMQLPDMTVDRISDSVARIMTGTARTADVNLFTLSNPAAREVYARMTGKELPNTNEATRDELWNQIAQNRVETAAAETLDVADRTKGIIEQRMGDTYEASGQALFAKELAGIDQNDNASLEATVVSFDDFYRAGRRNLPMDEVMAMGNPFHVRVPKELREAAYNAGREDRFRASDTAKGMQMTLGQTAKESRSMGRKTGSKGKLITDGLSEEMRQELPATQMALLRTLARTFNINIHVVDTLAQQEGEASPNGFYVDGEVYLSMTGDRPLPYIFAHEITHHMQVYAPMEYNQLKELVRERWGDQGGIDAAIETKRAHYAQHNVSLSYEDALDEIIADSTYEILQDEGFVDELCRSHRNIAQALLDAIKNVISKIRATLAEGELFTPAQNANLLSELDILKDFEKIWANGLMRAAENRDAVGTVSNMESVQYQLAKDKQGKTVVILDENIFDGMMPDEKPHQYIADFIASEVGKSYKILSSGYKVYIGEDLPGEFTQSKYTQSLKRNRRDRGLLYAKNQSAQNFGEVIEIADDGKYESNTKPKHAIDAKYGFYKYRSRFAIKRKDGNATEYDVELVVRHDADGKRYLYDITDIKKVGILHLTSTTQGSHGYGGANNAPQGTPTDNSIPDSQHNGNKKLSLPDTDSTGRKLSEGQQEYFRNSKARDEDGNLQVVYHGTPAGEFYTFDKAKGDVEGDFGSGFYFSDSEDDMAANYEGGGPDFDNKVERLAERIADEEDIDHEEAEKKAREQLFVGDNRFEVYLNIENPAIVGETILLDQESLDPGYDPEDFDSEEEYYEQIEQDVYNKIYELEWEVDRNIEPSHTEGLPEILWEAYYDGGIGIEELKAKINGLFMEDEDGKLVGNEVTRQIIESLGYDGIIDPTVSTKWNMDIPTGTTHYIVFNPNQIKYVDNLNPTEDPDIRYSLPDEDDVYDYINSNETEFVDFPPVKDYDRVATEVKNKSVEELSKQVEILKRDKRLTHDKVLDKASVKSEMNNLVRTLMTHSEGTTKKTDSKLVDTAVKNASIIYRAFKEGDVASAASTAYYAAEHIVENLQLIDDTAFHNYKALRDTMRTTAVTISEEDKASIPDFKDFRKRNMGRLRIVNEGGIPVDTLYQELCEVYPELFDQEVAHPADQLMAMADVREALEPYDIMLSAEETEQLVKEAAHDLLEISVKGKPWKSWADRQKEVYDSKLKTMKAMHKEALNDLRIKERMRATRMVNAEKLKAKEYKEKQRDGKARAKANASIMKNYKWLADRLVKPTDDKHIPDGFRKSLADMLQVFDLQSARSKALEEKYGAPSQKTIKMRELKARLEEIAKEDDTGIFQYDGYVIDLMEALANRIDGLTLDQASTEDLASIDTLLKAIVANIRNYNKAFSDDIKATISELAEKTIEADNERIAKRGKKADRSGIIGGADSMLNESMVSPRDFFEQIGGGVQEAFLSMRKGFDKHVDNLTKTREFFDSIFTPYNKKTKLRKRAKPGSIIEKWRDTTFQEELQLESGKTIKLNPAQMMTLYCLMKREQAQGHIFGSGIVASRVDSKSRLWQSLGAKIQPQGSAVMITLTDAENIISKLTRDQIEMADKLQGFLNGPCAEWGNEASLTIFGYKKFTEKNYFPIKSADQYLDSNFESRQAAERIKNFGFTKGTVVNANNPIMIDDIFRVVADHINKMSLYNAFAAPISDFTRVYNYKSRDDSGVITGSVKASLEDAHGKKALNYINNFMADLNNQAQTRTEGFGRFLNKSLANYKKAMIGGNLRVAFQQPTAVVRAFMLMSPKYFVNAHVNPIKNLRDMKEHCQIARWKSWGHNQVDMARDIDEIMMNNEWTRIDALTMKMYGGLDNLTWSTIWAAIRKETAALHPEVKVNSEEFYAICNDRASEVFDKTQVVDSVFHRSEVMRNTDTMSKMVTSFMAEPTRTFNMVRTEMVKAREEWKDGNKGKAVAHVNRTLSVFMINAAMVSAAAAVADALRDKDPDDDGEDEGFIPTWLENFWANFWGNVNPINMIPVANDVWGVAEGWSITNMALDGWADLVKSAMALTDPEKRDYRKFAESVSTVVGIPLKNSLRELEIIFGYFGIEVFAAEAGEEEKEVKQPLKIRIGSKFDNFLKGIGINRSESEKLAASFDRRVKQYERSAKNMTDADKQEYLWGQITKNYTTYIKDGNFAAIKDMRAMLEATGGDYEKFDKSVLDKTKAAMKKSIGTDEATLNACRNFLIDNYEYTEGKISAEVLSSSETATDFQLAVCTNDFDGAVETLRTLLNAGMTEADAYALFLNRSKAIKAKNFSTGEFAYPATGETTSGFGYRDEPIAGVGNNHTGIDIAVAENTDIAAADGGKVIYADYKPGLGYHVKIDHGNGRVSIYGHLNGYYVQKGDAVTKGQTIGLSGSTGMSTGPHLHFGVTENGQYVDPMNYFR